MGWLHKPLVTNAAHVFRAMNGKKMYLSQFVVVGFDDRTKVVNDIVYEIMLLGKYWVGKPDINSRRFWVLDHVNAT